MNAKKICALALSLGLSASCAPKGDAGLIKDAFEVVGEVVGVYAGYRAVDTLIPKYTGPSHKYAWYDVKKYCGKVVDIVKSYIDMGVELAIDFADQKFKSEKGSFAKNKIEFDDDDYNNIKSYENIKDDYKDDGDN